MASKSLTKYIPSVRNRIGFKKKHELTCFRVIHYMAFKMDKKKNKKKMYTNIVLEDILIFYSPLNYFYIQTID